MGSAGGLEGAASTGQGRAARRRQLARWKKNRRRALAATAVALVGGGLTVAALPNGRPSTSHTHAAPPPEPVTAATPGTATTGSPSEQPDTPVTRHPGSRPPATTGRRQNTTAAIPPAATTGRPPETAAAVRPSASLSAGPRTAPASAEGTHVGDAEAPATAPETTAPAAAEHPGAGSSIVNILPTAPVEAPTSPTQVCLIGVCIG
ncbi:hypothetical protein [Streptomyces sp. NPDC059909]|uniref:hypothetical protein n=1 Tax=Streptomyces sp. NPDC059909 TaxID=3346998 RepID=UPI003657C52A